MKQTTDIEHRLDKAIQNAKPLPRPDNGPIFRSTPLHEVGKRLRAAAMKNLSAEQRKALALPDRKQR